MMYDNDYDFIMEALADELGIVNYSGVYESETSDMVASRMRERAIYAQNLRNRTLGPNGTGHAVASRSDVEAARADAQAGRVNPTTPPKPAPAASSSSSTLNVSTLPKIQTSSTPAPSGMQYTSAGMNGIKPGDSAAVVAAKKAAQNKEEVASRIMAAQQQAQSAANAARYSQQQSSSPGNNPNAGPRKPLVYGSPEYKAAASQFNIPSTRAERRALRHAERDARRAEREANKPKSTEQLQAESKARMERIRGLVGQLHQNHEAEKAKYEPMRKQMDASKAYLQARGNFNAANNGFRASNPWTNTGDVEAAKRAGAAHRAEAIKAGAIAPNPGEGVSKER